MTPIVIPFATGPIRLFMGFACLFIAVFIFWWFTPKFITFLRQFRTVKVSIAIAGAFIYAVVFGFAMIPTVIFVELVQNPKTVISEAGIFEEGTLLHEPTRIGWNEIQTVSCLTSRSGRVNSLSIRAMDGRKITVGNSRTAILGPTYDLLHERLGDGSVQRCWIPFRR